MHFQLESCAKIYDELAPLIELHQNEVAHFKDFELCINRQWYEDLEKAGCLRFFTCREEGKLIGYSFFFVAANRFYKNRIDATEDSLFIHPDHRGGGVAFISWCDAQLQAEGVQTIYHYSKKSHDFGLLLERIGYQLVDLVYVKRVNNG